MPEKDFMVRRQLQRMGEVGLKPLADTPFVRHGDWLVESTTDGFNLYAPQFGVNPSHVKLIRYSPEFMGRHSPKRSLHVLEELPYDPQPGRKKSYMLERTTNGSGGGLNDIASRMALESLDGMTMDVQLVLSGFTLVGGDDHGTEIFRYKDDHNDTVAILQSGKLAALFNGLTPDSSVTALMARPDMNLVGVVDIGPAFEETRGLIFSGDWMELIVDLNQNGRPRLLQSTITREPTYDELDIEPFDVTKDQSGFVIGAMNDVDIVRGIESLNGVPIEEIEQRMRPGALSAAGFLGERESLRKILELDLETVTSLGLTHQEIALPLRYIQRMYQMGVLSQNGGVVSISGLKYDVNFTQWRGTQESPFDDASGSYDFTVTNKTTGIAFAASSLLSDLIGKYGFYEGDGTPYRVSPEQIVRTFTHLKEKARI